jgi:glutaredoxin
MSITTDCGSTELSDEDSEESFVNASHLNCTTPVIPFDGPVGISVTNGCTFRVADLIHTGQTKKCKDATIHPTRSGIVSLPGIVILGTRACPYTLRAVEMLHKTRLPFYYVDVANGRLGDYHEEMDKELSEKYYFTNKTPEGGFHRTVPIVLMDGKLIGGNSELDSALSRTTSLEEIQKSCRLSVAGVAYIGVPEVEDGTTLLEESLLGGAIRAVYTM